MEAEILQVLKEIRGSLYIIATVVSIGVVFWIFSSASMLIGIFKAAFKKDWKDQAIEFFDSEKFDELIAHCKKRELSHKNDPNVYYWQARVYRQRGEIEKSKELFDMVSKIAPDWHKDYVQPFIEEN